MLDSALPKLKQQSRPSTPRTLLCAERIFKYTADRRPFYDDLSAIFATLAISLPLESHHVGLILPSNSFAFSFTSNEAIDNLMHLKMQQNIQSTDAFGRKTSSITITSYQVDRLACMDLMQSFLWARFIKCANDLENVKFRNSLLLQMTPKGIAILDLFVQRNGVMSPDVKKILKSSYNSMRLIVLERDPTTDYITASKQLVEIVFQRFAGCRPNYHNFVSAASSSTQNSSVTDDTVTYADSSSGVKIADCKRVHLKEYRDCFSGLEAKRWILDCTTAVSDKEALTLLDAFLTRQLIVGLDSRSLASKETFIIDKSAYYTLTDAGKRLAGWNASFNIASISQAAVRSRSPIPRVSSPATDKKQKLHRILENPALRLLFREHLEDNFCEENLSFYLESIKVIALYEELKKNGSTSARKIRVNLCITEAWCVYQVYLAQGSASEVNIDHDLRVRVREGMNAIEARKAKNSDREKTSKTSLELSMANLKKIIDLLEEVRSQVFRLMALDSVPKFMKTRKFIDLGVDI
ncbi:regulator of G protein signaling domain-containing protein [Kockiozyma suomiensis]|uniref:regulator of G protein signaling domain-containing protein n=1 Tax=Kockiozyma suomiensis TaxID=1337062 RepID=UPI003343CA5B